MSHNAMLAHHYAGENVTGWYASRKLNGWHGIWSGGKLLTLGRYSGMKEINAPDWWLRELPDTDVEGELWHHSDDISLVKSICGQGPKGKFDARWKDIKFCIFNKYYKPGVVVWEKWGDTYKFLETYFYGQVGQIARLLPQTRINDMDHFSELARDMVGEGLMLINPASYYEHKRSHNLLKVKKMYETEAIVLAMTDGKGKHLGRMGALECQLTWDEKVASVFGGKPEMVGRTVRFSIGGFNDIERETDWPFGSLVNFSYFGVTKDAIPVSANFVRKE